MPITMIVEGQAVDVRGRLLNLIHTRDGTAVQTENGPILLGAAIEAFYAMTEIVAGANIEEIDELSARLSVECSFDLLDVMSAWGAEAESDEDVEREDEGLDEHDHRTSPKTLPALKSGEPLRESILLTGLYLEPLPAMAA